MGKKNKSALRGLVRKQMLSFWVAIVGALGLLFSFILKFSKYKALAWQYNQYFCQNSQSAAQVEQNLCGEIFEKSTVGDLIQTYSFVAESINHFYLDLGSLTALFLGLLMTNYYARKLSPRLTHIEQLGIDRL